MSSDESKEEQLDRELIELLNELRVALPGVQVLFAFLLGVYHRLNWRRGDKEHLLVVSNRLAISGTAFLALAISGAVFVVTDMLFEPTSAAVVAAATAAFFGWFWYGLPLLRRLRD